MTRKKPSLSIQKPKRQRQLTTKINSTTRLDSSRGLKRKRILTPHKEHLGTPFKSPFKSPLYKAYKITPTAKTNKNSSKRLSFTSPTKEVQNTIAASSHTSATSAENVNTDDKSETVEHLDNSSTVQEEISELLPTVLGILSEEGRLDLTLLSFFKQVRDGKFPLDNVALLLFSEVVQWFECDSTTQMRYSKDSKTFWKLGYRLFGERFVNFMGGPKSQGEAILRVSERGQFSPETSRINFAVPNPKVLRSFDPYHVNGERKPGLHEDLINTLSENLDRKSACLTFDGKKIKQGLSENCGDVDLLGFESGQTLQERKTQLDTELEEVQALQESLASLHANERNIRSLPLTYRECIRKTLTRLKNTFPQHLYGALGFSPCLRS